MIDTDEQEKIIMENLKKLEEINIGEEMKYGNNI